jgi:hypothetical protein
MRPCTKSFLLWEGGDWKEGQGKAERKLGGGKGEIEGYRRKREGGRVTGTRREDQKGAGRWY